ncbi:3-deoxy-D-manno-octulosonic acid transferase [Tenacibaculum sp. SG-28]|uniref:3-deoxy-D-manno-octulosonic acid transferase n=1 Tax=Tenacibaculum sp. SG-28 TaxID=754426 RepID=UPI000CF41B75|nr:glycosyltransferase N-terminal domain-containing protein [Tenacibaculum sp. SG-28]PQJ21579.1 3-deoxy-D-manno-octulosonic acid transferase [Tenacibaculum sp. SG-28]
MNVFYNCLLSIASVLLHLIALFSPKIKLFITGRKNTFQKLEPLSKNDKTIWFHAASLGEFEQGRPVLESLRKSHPNYKIVLSFFSPSGYEVRKNYPHADVVCYLPLDTNKNMNRFIELVHPELAIIIKYEFWPNLLTALHNREIKTILISGIFRENQLFFKPYGSFMRQKLAAIDHFFVQNNKSKELLNTIQIDNVTVSGDTRFDRVHDILQQDNTLDFVAKFKQEKYCCIAGSTWPEDEELLVNYINENSTSKEKFILAPHAIKADQIEALKKSITKKTVLFSEKNLHALEDFQVLIIDTIGLLTKIYAYADVAYVGGGLATGLHNILEPAVFGIPVLFGGHKYQKFQEARDLIALNGATIVTNKNDFYNTFVAIEQNDEKRIAMGETNRKYIIDNIGATKTILNYIENII